MFTDQEPCLTVDDVTEGTASTYDVRLQPNRQVEPCWTDMLSRPLVRIIGDPSMHSDPGEVLFQMAVILKSHRSLKAVHFRECHVMDLDHFAVAVTAELASSQTNLTLRFEKCTIGPRAGYRLGSMLAYPNQVMGELFFVDCEFNSSSAKAIELGLASNQSLRKFDCILSTVIPHATPIYGVTGMLNSNQGIVKLDLSCVAVMDDMDGLRDSDDDNDEEINLMAAETILMKCFAVSSLKTLGFSFCTFTPEAFRLLTNVLSSNHQVIDTLILNDVSYNDASPLSISPGRVQVRKLSLRGTTFEYETWERMIQEVVENPTIQCLDLSDVAGGEGADDFEKIRDLLLRNNCGPRQLFITAHGSDLASILDGLQENTNLQELTIEIFSEEDALAIATGLTTFKGLRKLSLGLCDMCLDTFFPTLLQNLEQNTTLRTMSLFGLDLKHNAIAQQYLPKIRYNLAMNRLGRDKVFTEVIPHGIWSYILAKTSNEAVGVNSVLRGKPDLIPPSRKRKDRDELE